MYTLFPGEHIVTESSEKNITLTTHRICCSYKVWGRSYDQHIMLEHISSCEHDYGSRVWLLIVAAVLTLFGIFAGISESITVFSSCMAIALFVTLLYFMTRHRVVVIKSSSAKMPVNVVHMHREQAIDFLNKIAQTQAERMHAIHAAAEITI